MPVIIPTPDEVAAMPWPSRRKALARVRHIVNQMRDVDMPTERLWAESDPDWAEVTRREARRLLALLPADPCASEHRVGVA